MLVTRILAGRPYQSYVPKPLFPARDARLTQRFREADAALAATCNADAFAERFIIGKAYERPEATMDRSIARIICDATKSPAP
jgi:hypothetical protein